MSDDDFPRVVALHDYAARSPKEFSFRKGELMIITDVLDDNWYQGKQNGVAGCIPTAYVTHAKNWREQQQPQASAPQPGPAHTQQQHHARPDTSKSVRAAPMPGMVPMLGGPVSQPPPDSRFFAPGVSDDELIKAKPLAMQPDRPDLAKALNVRNQAARVAGPQKTTTGNELAQHLSQLKQKKAYTERWTDPHEAELKNAMQSQMNKVQISTSAAQKEANLSTFDRKMAARRQANNY